MELVEQMSTSLPVESHSLHVPPLEEIARGLLPGDPVAGDKSLRCLSVVAISGVQLQ